MGEELGQHGSEVATATAPLMTEEHRWGEPISDGRRAELQAMLDVWNSSDADHGNRKGPFDGVSLTGADVFWLAELARNETGMVPDLHLEQADLTVASLQGANLTVASLQGANLTVASLQGANLSEAHLERAGLSEAHLEGANLNAAQLQGADLSGASFDSKTTLNDASLDGKTRLGDIQWAGVGTVNLTQINRERVRTLGDERTLTARSPASEREAAVRAYRQLAAQMRVQGMAEVADRFAERAQVRQRKLTFRRLLADWRRPWRLPGHLLRWLFSWFLALLAGYGYHPGRSACWYLAVIFGFAFAFYRLGPGEHVPFSHLGAVVFSATSFHGRGFFPGGSPGHSLTLDDPVTVLAAAEAIIGLLIEISFIATFTQRFFGSK